jgi:ribonuclease HI
MPSANSSFDQKIIVAVDGGLRHVDDNIIGGTSAVIFRLEPVVPESKRIVVRTVSVHGEFHSSQVTNNRMELLGFILGAELLEKELVDQPERSTTIEFWSDSQYALGMIFREWRAKKNQDLVRNARAWMDRLSDYSKVSGGFIRGHQDHFVNEFADLVAGLCVERKDDIGHQLKFGGIEETCLLCDNFPCERREDCLGTQPIKKWKERFIAIRTGLYGPPCANRKAYDAKFSLGGSFTGVTKTTGAGGRS